MPESVYSHARGDWSVASKHADLTLERGYNAWTMFFFNTPAKGKCLQVCYEPCNYPALNVYVTANWKARIIAAAYRRDGYTETEKW